LFRVGVALVILLAILTIRNTSNPWGVAARENLKQVLTTEWDYQPVVEKVMQYSLQVANMEWPLFSSHPVVSNSKQNIAAVTLQLPVSGKIVRGFGLVIDPIDNMERFHSGIDIAAPLGSEVRAVREGLVKLMGDSPALGRYILIEHEEGFFTLYAGLSNVAVGEGQSVQAGQAIGEVGDNGDVSGGGLHFELRENNKLVDPLTRIEVN